MILWGVYLKPFARVALNFEYRGFLKKVYQNVLKYFDIKMIWPMKTYSEKQTKATYNYAYLKYHLDLILLILSQISVY